MIAAMLIGHVAATHIPTAKAVFGIGDIVLDTKAWFETIDQKLGANAAKIASKEVARMLRTLIIHAMDGGPTFVTNWRNHSRKSLDGGGTIARNLIGEAAFGVDGDPTSATLCNFFRDSIGSKFNAKPVDKAFADISRAYRLDDAGTYKLLTKCTLPTTISIGGVQKPFEIKNFQDSFEGGWPVFEKLLEPNNNYFGVLSITAAEIGKQREAQKQSALNEAISGGGFLSTITKSGQIKSPGKLIGDTVSKQVGSIFDCLNTVISFSSLGVCITDFSIIANQVTNFRNIAESAGLLDDEKSDDGDAGDPVPTPEVGPPVCDKACGDAAEATCNMDPSVNSSILYEVCFNQTFDECKIEMCQAQ